MHGPVRDMAQTTHKENLLQVSVLGGKLELKSKTWENTHLLYFVHHAINGKRDYKQGSVNGLPNRTITMRKLVQ